ncbi:MAG: hypothetical protein R3D71_06605 [Rickettsiales bacterium]
MYLKRTCLRMDVIMERTNGSDITVNGVLLPHHLVRELQKLGRALEWYHKGELEKAVIATAVDRNLIDDPDGHNFNDKLELTDSEKNEKKRKKSSFKDFYSLPNDQPARDDLELRQKQMKKEREAEEERAREKKNKEGFIKSFCRRLKESRSNSHNHKCSIYE